jgi:hypothetical protein
MDLLPTALAGTAVRARRQNPRNRCCGQKIRGPFSHVDGNDKLNRIGLGASGVTGPLRAGQAVGAELSTGAEKKSTARSLGGCFAASRPNCWPHNDGLISGERRMKLW